MTSKRILCWLTLLFPAMICQAQINVYDGFEAQSLSKIWRQTKLAPNACEIQSSIVRKGKSAAKITLKSGDIFEAGYGKSLDSERDELMEAKSILSVEGARYEYQFSLFLPDSFPIVSTRLVIAQWKQYCSKYPCTDDSPVMAIRYVSGKLYITLQADTIKIVLYKVEDEIRNQWLDFRFLIRFSKQSNGEVQAFLNEKEIIHYKGVTSYSGNRGDSPQNRYYFKMGLYRDLMKEPMTIYIDEYRKKELIE